MFDMMIKNLFIRGVYERVVFVSGGLIVLWKF